MLTVHWLEGGRGPGGAGPLLLGVGTSLVCRHFGLQRTLSNSLGLRTARAHWPWTDDPSPPWHLLQAAPCLQAACPVASSALRPLPHQRCLLHSDSLICCLRRGCCWLTSPLPDTKEATSEKKSSYRSPTKPSRAVKPATATVQSLGKVRLFAGDIAGSVEPGGQVERPGCVQSGAQSRELDLLWG